MLKHLKEEAQKDFDTAVGTVDKGLKYPIMGATGAAGAAAGLGIGAPAGLAALIFGGKSASRRGDYSVFGGASNTTVITGGFTLAGGAGGVMLGRALSAGVSGLIGGTAAGVFNIFALPYRAARYSMNNNSNSNNNHRERSDSSAHVEPQQSSYAYSTDTPSAPPSKTELELFFAEREKYSNQKRITVALFDVEKITTDHPRYVEAETKIHPFFKVKIDSEEQFEILSNAVMDPVSMDIPTRPVLVPGSTDQVFHMYDYDGLISCTKAPGSNANWDAGQYWNPLTGKAGDQSMITPAYGTQSLIERIIIRCYEFREIEDAKAGALGSHRKAIDRLDHYFKGLPTNQERFLSILGGDASLKTFLDTLLNHPKFNLIFNAGHHDQIKGMISQIAALGTLPRMPVFNKDKKLMDYDPKTMLKPNEITIAYDVQNLIEQILQSARLLRQDFELNFNQNRQKNRV